MLTIPVPTLRSRATSLLRALQNQSSTCPCHACTHPTPALTASLSAARKLAVAAPMEKEYAFEMAASNIRYGNGVTREVGMDFKNLGVKKVAVFTDHNVLNLAPMRNAIAALESEGIQYEIYSKVRVEPKDPATQ
ncbi:hypothetical protein V1522DRAFT_171411 [Lipomyces starkeyi]